MAAKGLTLVTMADVAKLSNKHLAKPAEVLVKHNAMLKDIPFMEMNEGTIHKESIRSALPEVYYRKANQAIPASKSTIEERSFTAAHFESKSQMDVKVASRGGTE
ncbi:MAG: phage major capsid protein, partial [Afipia sp.]